jgi:hypothetical protein
MGLSNKAKKLKSLKNQLKKGGSEQHKVNLQKRIETLENTKG